MSKWHVVAVHGVGDANPGQTIQALANRLPDDEAGGRQGYQLGELLLDGERYPVANAPSTEGPSFYEVNWADVRRPPVSQFGVARHMLDVILSLLDIAHRWHFKAGNEGHTGLLGVYRFLIESALLWALGYTLLARWLHLQDLEPRPTIAVGTAAAIVLLIVGLLLGGSSRTLRSAAAFWAVLVQVTAGAVALSLLETLNFVLFSTLLYGLIAVAIGLSLFLGMLQAVWRFWRRPWEAATRCGAACLPIAVLAVVGACVWAVDPGLVGKPTPQASLTMDGYELQTAHWKGADKDKEKAATYEKLTDDLRKTEERKKGLRETQIRALRLAMWHATSALISTTIAFAVLGVAVLIGVLVYALLQVRNGPSGLFAHASIRWLIGVVLPLLTVFAMAVALYDAVTFLHAPTSPYGALKTVWGDGVRDLFSENDLYQRLGVILLVLIVPVGAVVSDIFGDITFWSAKEDENLSGPNRFRVVVGERFSKLLQWLLMQDANATILIVAHSQGTVIAIDGLQKLAEQDEQDLKRIRLVTMASPLHTLYAPLFGLYEKESCAALAQLKEWKNYFREGDPIGGPINFAGCENFRPWPGGHTHYWTDNTMPWTELLRQ